MSSAIEEFDYSVNLLRALLWRHNDATSLQGLLQSKSAWYASQQSQFWSDWFTNVFNLNTANEFGLSVWAIILGVPLSLIVPPNAGPQFGFGPRELLSDRADAASSWTQSGGVTLTAGQTDPNAGTKAVKIDLSTASGTRRVTIPTLAGGIPAGNTTLQFQAKLISGTQGTIASDINGVTMGNWPTLNTSTWTTVTLTLNNATAGTTAFNIVSNTTSAAVVEIFNPQLCADTEVSNGRFNFNNGNFGASAAGVGLTLDQKRILLKLRYYKLISRCTIPEINARLKAILGQYGSVYVLDGNDMRYTTYVFGFQPNSALQFVLENFDVLPRPAGVGVRFVVSTRPAFGFGPYNQNFNNGNFWAAN